MPFEARTLGRTGLKVGPIGLGSSYGLSEAGVEEAFERGCNYCTGADYVVRVCELARRVVARRRAAT